jgi:hypothetical protein
MELYDKLVGIVSTWLDGLDVATLSPADAFTAFKLLAPSLESLAIIRAKIGEQRAEGPTMSRRRCKPIFKKASNGKPPRFRKPSNCCAEDSTTTLNRRQTKPGLTVTSHFGSRIS